jgi:hypothetical protein
MKTLIIVRFHAALAVMLVAASLFSCHDYDPLGDDPPINNEPPTWTELLTTNDWILIAMTTDPATNGITDLYESQDYCDRDDRYRYNEDGSFTLDEGAEKCHPDAPQTKGTGSWVFLSETELSTVINNSMVVLNVFTLNDTILQGTFIQSGHTVTQTFTNR